MTDQKLAVVLAGVAFHHGGLSASDRRTVEDAFLNGQIGVICSTSTLAVGVNLPCYLVILKGTTHWTDNGIQEYGDLEVMQMLGRAGRPQFESSACAVILTQTHKVGRYEAMVSGQEILESSLHQNLIEHLNAEVGLGTVTSLTTAKQWLSSSFLYVRLKRNPQHYSFREDVEHCAGEDFLERLCEKDLETLQQANLIQGADPLKSTEYGDAMARYYVSFDTMHSFMSLPPKAKSSDIVSGTSLGTFATNRRNIAVCPLASLRVQGNTLTIGRKVILQGNQQGARDTVSCQGGRGSSLPQNLLANSSGAWRSGSS